MGALGASRCHRSHRRALKEADSRASALVLPVSQMRSAQSANLRHRPAAVCSRRPPPPLTTKRHVLTLQAHRRRLMRCAASAHSRRTRTCRAAWPNCCLRRSRRHGRASLRTRPAPGTAQLRPMGAACRGSLSGSLTGTARSRCAWCTGSGRAAAAWPACCAARRAPRCCATARWAGAA